MGFQIWYISGNFKFQFTRYLAAKLDLIPGIDKRIFITTYLSVSLNFFFFSFWNREEVRRLHTQDDYIVFLISVIPAKHILHSLTSIHFFVFIEFSSCDSFSIVLWYCLQSCPSWIAFCNLHVVGHENETAKKFAC